MKCPKCNNGEVKEQISIKGFIFKKKIVITFCPLCDYRNEHIFNLSSQDVEIENKQRANLENKTKITYDTTKTIK